MANLWWLYMNYLWLIYDGYIWIIYGQFLMVIYGLFMANLWWLYMDYLWAIYDGYIWIIYGQFMMDILVLFVVCLHDNALWQCGTYSTTFLKKSFVSFVSSQSNVDVGRRRQKYVNVAKTTSTLQKIRERQQNVHVNEHFKCK